MVRMIPEERESTRHTRKAMDRPPNADAAYLNARMSPEDAKRKGYVSITRAFSLEERAGLLSAVRQMGMNPIVIVAVPDGTEVWRLKRETVEGRTGFSASAAGRLAHTPRRGAK